MLTRIILSSLWETGMQFLKLNSESEIEYLENATCSHVAHVVLMSNWYTFNFQVLYSSFPISTQIFLQKQNI